MKTTLFTLTLSLLVSASAFAMVGKSVSIEGAEAKSVFASAEAVGVDTRSGSFTANGVYCSVTKTGTTETAGCSVQGGKEVTGSAAQDMIKALHAAGIFLGKPFQEGSVTVSDVSLQQLKCIRQEYPVSDYEKKSTMVTFFCSATI